MEEKGKRKKEKKCLLFVLFWCGCAWLRVCKVSLFFVATVGLCIVGGRSLSFQLLFLCWNSWDSPTAV